MVLSKWRGLGVWYVDESRHQELVLYTEIRLCKN